ncbi:MAG: hypothetical protein HGA45_11985 [Chloroflexales bacterium]|nr:hypothetical protein [Chloroflexales bacterium]
MPYPATQPRPRAAQEEGEILTPAPPPETQAQASIRRSAPVIAGGVAGASVIALLAVSSVVAPSFASGITWMGFLAWLGGLGGNALAGWLTAWAEQNPRPNPVAIPRPG